MNLGNWSPFKELVQIYIQIMSLVPLQTAEAVGIFKKLFYHILQKMAEENKGNIKTLKS